MVEVADLTWFAWRALWSGARHVGEGHERRGMVGKRAPAQRWLAVTSCSYFLEQTFAQKTACSRGST